jgi:benzoate membrane transport protein
VSGRIEPITAGVVAAVVGFASTFAVVLQGLRAVGADRHQAASGLTALCITMGITAIVIGVRTRIPVSIAWSTPGAALLVSAGHVDGGYRAALGAFLLTGVLIVLAGFWGGLARAIAAIPPAIAAAMLAGVLLPLCVAPVHAMDQRPWLTAPVVATWLVLLRVARPWAVPGALGVAIVAIVIDHAPHLGPTSGLLPHLSASSPTLTAGAVIGLGVPLFVVTMASQNVPGMTVLRSFGYRPRLRPLLLGTGAATAVGAPFGAHAVNLAAITAALCAGPHAGADPGRRWMASVSAGVAYLVLGLAAGVATAFVAASPVVVIEAVAGLALLGALGAALATAAADEALREPAVVTFAVSASGVAALGVSSAFWGLVAGLALAWILPREHARPAEVEAAAEAAA